MLTDIRLLPKRSGSVFGLSNIHKGIFFYKKSLFKLTLMQKSSFFTSGNNFSYYLLTVRQEVDIAEMYILPDNR